jgi:hypothetical protein
MLVTLPLNWQPHHGNYYAKPSKAHRYVVSPLTDGWAVEFRFQSWVTTIGAAHSLADAQLSRSTITMASLSGTRSSMQRRRRSNTMRKASEKPLLTLIEADGVHDTPVPASPATLDEPEPAPNSQPTEWALEHALGVVKAAGYRISKPKAKYAPRRRDRVGPTIVCRFSDGEITRMSVNTTLENLDWYRGERLAQAAWRSRWRRRQRIYTPYPIVEPVPPAIVAMHFEEQDGTVLSRRPDDGGVS